MSYGDGYISYIFYGDRYDCPAGSEDFFSGTVFTVINGEIREVRNEMPPGAIMPDYNSGFFKQTGA